MPSLYCGLLSTFYSLFLPKGGSYEAPDLMEGLARSGPVRNPNVNGSRRQPSFLVDRFIHENEECLRCWPRLRPVGRKIECILPNSSGHHEPNAFLVAIALRLMPMLRERRS